METDKIIMDNDNLIDLLGNILSELESINSSLTNISIYIPDSPDNSAIENKLDEIIKLLKQIRDK